MSSAVGSNGLAVTALTVVLSCLCLSSCGSAETRTTEHARSDTPLNDYHQVQAIGSDSLYNPASAFLHYTLDTLQLPENFDTDDFSSDLELVWEHLSHPRTAIDNEGGFRRFVNREIFPIDADHHRDSYAALPNYGLHLLGGGIAYRRDVEWFTVRGYRYPRLAAASLAMVSEVLQEALEVQNTTDADPVADVYLFRPLGILLFSQTRVATAIQTHLNPAIWPTLSAWNLSTNQFVNTGISYVYRPPRLGFDKAGLFVYTGLNNLVGLSHRLPSGRTLSWGVGVAVQEIVRQRNIQADTRASLGLFLDQNKSLLASLVVNDVGSTRVRLNLYPGFLFIPRGMGLFLSVHDDRDLSAGFVYRLPIGVALGHP
ncbi:hypothetical protein ACUNV4_22695 [Granulosicoccus sp. 3-233]|uniref:hypothetical protein n=1 Tax=Granulosicoccus sp. 3-233 TaxID=3417969 RepID=UPI003D34623C